MFVLVGIRRSGRQPAQSGPTTRKMKVVTVHRGARDQYQVACALHESGMLDSLVTDLYWPADRSWIKAFERVASRKLTTKLHRRYAPALPDRAVRKCWLTGAWAFLLDNRKSVPFAWQRRAMRMCDMRLGVRAAQIANARDAALLSYSYYAHSAFTHFTGTQPKILFQLHPHPASVREILSRERELHPDCAASLNKESELALPEPEFQMLVNEVKLAQHWLVASSFTRNTLVEHGVPGERIKVIPYGTDLDWFTPKMKDSPQGRVLRVLFVGTVGQRKGIKYLLAAMEGLPSGSVELTVCGRAVDNLSFFQETRVPVRFLRFPASQELLDEFHAADLFVLPSVAEGFGHVLLEAMSCGLPVISTSRTAALDLIRPGQEGFVVEPGNTAQLSESIEYFLRNPKELQRIGAAARSRAEHFTWARFRKGVADAVSEIIASPGIEMKAPQTAGFPAD